MLYVAAGGVDPKKVLPVLLDAGTDNKALRDHPWYLGLPQSRLKGDEYFSLVHEFVNAVHFRWPNAGAFCGTRGGAGRLPVLFRRVYEGEQWRRCYAAMRGTNERKAGPDVPVHPRSDPAGRVLTALSSGCGEPSARTRSKQRLVVEDTQTVSCPAGAVPSRTIQQCPAPAS
jgi:hypothetical protein